MPVFGPGGIASRAGCGVLTMGCGRTPATPPLTVPPWLNGIIIGFSIAAPVGPIGLLCLRRTIRHGRVAGFLSGLGAATADALFGVVAALGLTVVSTILIDHRLWLQGAGGVFLCYLGVATFRAPIPTSAAPAPEPLGWGTAYFSTLALTLTNPVTILSFVGIFAGVGVNPQGDGRWAAGMLVSGVFIGSAAWWLLLSGIAGWLGPRLTVGGLLGVNVVSGVILAGFGGWQLWQVAWAVAGTGTC